MQGAKKLVKSIFFLIWQKIWWDFCNLQFYIILFKKIDTILAWFGPLFCQLQFHSTNTEKIMCLQGQSSQRMSLLCVLAVMHIRRDLFSLTHLSGFLLSAGCRQIYQLRKRKFCSRSLHENRWLAQWKSLLATTWFILLWVLLWDPTKNTNSFI